MGGGRPLGSCCSPGHGQRLLGPRVWRGRWEVAHFGLPSTRPGYSCHALGGILHLHVPCRSMKLTFKESGIFEGIPTYRFVAPNTLFANGSVYPPNEGFCPCLESGIQNVSTCRFSTCQPMKGGGRGDEGLIGHAICLIFGLSTLADLTGPEIIRAGE